MYIKLQCVLVNTGAFWCVPVFLQTPQMGESALRSHTKGEGHQKQEKSMSRAFVNFFVKQEIKVKTVTVKQEIKVKTVTTNTTSMPGDSLVVPPSPTATIVGPVASSRVSISYYVSKNDVMKAEIIINI